MIGRSFGQEGRDHGDGSGGVTTTADRSDGRHLPWNGILSWARLTSGLILFSYVTMHLCNHMAGLWSIDALDAGLSIVSGIWRNTIMSVVLYGALCVHLAIALLAIYRRDSFRAMTVPEALQLILGLLIPILLVQHVIANRYLHEVYGLNDDHTWVLLNVWVFSPTAAITQAAAILVAWAHGCTGLHLWLRYKPWYDQARPWLLTGAILVPTLALGGFVSAGKTVIDLAQTPGWMDLAIQAARVPPGPDIAAVLTLIDRLQIGFIVVLAFVLILRWGRLAHRHRSQGVRLSYGGGQAVSATRGMTVLEVSRANGIPHASVCGGRGRCSTCRVRVSKGLETLPPPEDAEAKVLDRIAAPPNVRLACQISVEDGLEVTPLLPPQNSGMAETRGGPSYLQGRELEIAVLFADIRGFTSISEQRLPYDVVFILNRYFAEMGAAIEGAGGRIDKFIGDGIMALFGVDSGPEAGARQAATAAREMARRLVELNESLSGDLNAPLRIGIGIHVGPAIVGEMGYGRVRGITAVGDTVNTASRLEAMTKDQGVQLVVSDAVATASGLDFADAAMLEIDVRGRDRPLTIRTVADATTIR